jgi:hypothetical protein
LPRSVPRCRDGTGCLGRGFSRVCRETPLSLRGDGALAWRLCRDMGGKWEPLAARHLLGLLARGAGRDDLNMAPAFSGKLERIGEVGSLLPSDEQQVEVLAPM